MITWFAAVALYNAIEGLIDGTTYESTGDASIRDCLLINAAQRDLIAVMLESGGR